VASSFPRFEPNFSLPAPSTRGGSKREIREIAMNTPKQNKILDDLGACREVIAKNAMETKHTPASKCCPLCRVEIKTLSMLKASDGRIWFNLACPDCNMAMDELDRWTFYIGGTKSTLERGEG
jgi:hypothetical protein